MATVPAHRLKGIKLHVAQRQHPECDAVVYSFRVNSDGNPALDLGWIETSKFDILMRVSQTGPPGGAKIALAQGDASAHFYHVSRDLIALKFGDDREAALLTFQAEPFWESIRESKFE